MPAVLSRSGVHSTVKQVQATAFSRTGWNMNRNSERGRETKRPRERERGHERQTGTDRQTVGKSTKRVGVKEISPGGSFHSISMNSANVASAKTKQIQTADKSAIDVEVDGDGDGDAQSMRYRLAGNVKLKLLLR